MCSDPQDPSTSEATDRDPKSNFTQSEIECKNLTQTEALPVGPSSPSKCDNHNKKKLKKRGRKSRKPTILHDSISIEKNICKSELSGKTSEQAGKPSFQESCKLTCTESIADSSKHHEGETVLDATGAVVTSQITCNLAQETDTKQSRYLPACTEAAVISNFNVDFPPETDNELCRNLSELKLENRCDQVSNCAVDPDVRFGEEEIQEVDPEKQAEYQQKWQKSQDKWRQG